MAKNSFPAIETFKKHTYRCKKSRASGHEERGKSTWKYINSYGNILAFLKNTFSYMWGLQYALKRSSEAEVRKKDSITKAE